MIAHLDLDKMHVVTEEGDVLPITTLIDQDGDETDDLDEATVIVCGKDNTWYTLVLAETSPVLLH